MTPLKHQQEGTPRFAYNEALCKARSVIERCFGVLKAEFRCLSAQRTLNYDPTMAGKIVNACAALHNMRLQNGIQIVIPPEEDIQPHRQPNVPNADVDREPISRRAAGSRIQERIIAQHFR